jgi:hypothetical protein
MKYKNFTIYTIACKRGQIFVFHTFTTFSEAVKSENKIIEVKSSYTYSKELIKNILKSLATRKLGFEFEFWIYTPNKKTFDKNVV